MIQVAATTAGCRRVELGVRWITRPIPGSDIGPVMAQVLRELEVERERDSGVHTPSLAVTRQERPAPSPWRGTSAAATSGRGR